MNNEERVIKLLEEIREGQKENFRKAEEMQKRVAKKLFWPLFLLVFLIIFVALIK